MPQWVPDPPETAVPSVGWVKTKHQTWRRTSTRLGMFWSATHTESQKETGLPSDNFTACYGKWIIDRWFTYWTWKLSSWLCYFTKGYFVYFSYTDNVTALVKKNKCHRIAVADHLSYCWQQERRITQHLSWVKHQKAIFFLSFTKLKWSLVSWDIVVPIQSMVTSSLENICCEHLVNLIGYYGTNRTNSMGWR